MTKTTDEFVDSTSNVATRVDINTKYGNNNLKEWVPKQLQLQQGEKILDIGCGDGTHIRDVSSYVKDENCCFALDYDKDMIARSINLSKDNSPRIKFFVMSMDDVTQTDAFSKNSFDLIYSVYAFYYTKNEVKLLNNLKKLLKSDGRISIIGPYSDNNKNWWDFLEQFMTVPNSLRKFANTEFMQGVEEYAKINFQDVKFDEFVNEITFPSIDVFRQYWKSNIYYDSKYDSDFELYAKKHFETHNNFQYSKKAEIITMQSPIIL